MARKQKKTCHLRRCEKRCRTCTRRRKRNNDRTKLRYAMRRAFALAYHGNKCAVCGTTENLEVDHVDPRSRKLDVSSGCSWQRFLDELEKTQLLCFVHHQEKTQCWRKHPLPPLEPAPF